MTSPTESRHPQVHIETDLKTDQLMLTPVSKANQKMAQWVKGLLYKHEELSGGLQHPLKNQVQQLTSVI